MPWKFCMKELNLLAHLVSIVTNEWYERKIVAKFIFGLSSGYVVAKAQSITGSEIPILTETYNRLSRLQISLSQLTHECHPLAMAANDRGGQGPTCGRGGDWGFGGRGRFQCIYGGKQEHLEPSMRPIIFSYTRGGKVTYDRDVSAAGTPQATVFSIGEGILSLAVKLS